MALQAGVDHLAIAIVTPFGSGSYVRALYPVGDRGHIDTNGLLGVIMGQLVPGSDLFTEVGSLINEQDFQNRSLNGSSIMVFSESYNQKRMLVWVRHPNGSGGAHVQLVWESPADVFNEYGVFTSAPSGKGVTTNDLDVCAGG